MIYLSLFLTFLKIGAFTFGGGYAMLPMIQQEVLAHGWMEMPQLVDFVAVSESTPGPFAVNIATYVGVETGGILGALCATAGVVLPSLVIITIVAKFYLAYRRSRVVQGFMSGLKPAVVGLIAAAMVSMAGAVLFPGGIHTAAWQTPALWCAVAIAAGAGVLLMKVKWHPIAVIGVSAAAGVGLGFLGVWG